MLELPKLLGQRWANFHSVYYYWQLLSDMLLSVNVKKLLLIKKIKKFVHWAKSVCSKVWYKIIIGYLVSMIIVRGRLFTSLFIHSELQVISHHWLLVHNAAEFCRMLQLLGIALHDVVDLLQLVGQPLLAAKLVLLEREDQLLVVLHSVTEKRKIFNLSFHQRLTKVHAVN